MDISIKQAKRVKIFMVTLCIVGIIAMIVSICLSVKGIVNAYNSNKNSDVVAFWLLIGGAALVIALAVAAMVDVCIANEAIFTFTDDKLIKKLRNKVKFEIPYSNIDNVQIDKLFLMGWALTIHCKNPFVKYGTDKALKRFDGYFKKDDLDRIQKKLTAFNSANNDSIKINSK